MDTNYDVEVKLDDDLLKKVVSSPSYPLTLFHHDEVFSPFIPDEQASSLQVVTITGNELEDIIEAVYTEKSGVSSIYDSLNKEEQDELDDYIESIYSDWIESLTNCLRAEDEAKILNEEFEWPDGENRESLLEKKKLEPKEALKKFIINAVKFHLRWAKVEMTGVPSIDFDNGKIKVGNLKFKVGGRVENWVSYNWYKCYRGCTKWKTVKKWKSPFSVSKTDLKIKTCFEVNLHTNKNILSAGCKVTELRIDHKFFNLFDLSGIANNQIENVRVEIYDANKFVQTLPLIEKDFVISQFEVTQSPSILSCGLSFSQKV